MNNSRHFCFISQLDMERGGDKRSVSGLLGSIWSITKVLTLHHTHEIDEHRLSVYQSSFRKNDEGQQNRYPRLCPFKCLLSVTVSLCSTIFHDFYVSLYHGGKGRLLYCRAWWLRDLKGCHSRLGVDRVTEALNNRDNCFWLKPEQDGCGLIHLTVCLPEVFGSWRRNSQGCVL